MYWLAYYAAPYNRRVSLKAYIYARKMAARSLGQPSLIKYIALWSMGENIRQMIHYINHHAAENESEQTQSSIEE
jgi:hypothetical protein